MTSIKVSGPSPWYHKFTGLEPWKFIDFRIQLVNKYGTGNSSEWFHGITDWGGKYFILQFFMFHNKDQDMTCFELV